MEPWEFLMARVIVPNVTTHKSSAKTAQSQWLTPRLTIPMSVDTLVKWMDSGKKVYTLVSIVTMTLSRQCATGRVSRKSPTLLLSAFLLNADHPKCSSSDYYLNSI